MEEKKIISPLGCFTQLSPLCTPLQIAPVTPVYTVVTPSGPIRVVNVTPCVRGGVRHDQTQPTGARRKLFDLETDASDEALVNRLEENELVINQQAEQIRVLQQAASMSEFDIFEVEYWRDVYHGQLKKFNALYRHCVNLARDIEKKDDIISTMVYSEEMAHQKQEKKLEAKLYTMRQAEQLLDKVSQQQRQLTTSTLALNSRMKRTKISRSPEGVLTYP